MSKNIFKSKVFWFNVLTGAAEVLNVIPLPPGTIIIASSIINVLLRLVTDKPVHIIEDKSLLNKRNF